MIPATLYRPDLELDVLTGIVREPYRAPMLAVTLPADVFGYGPNRYLYAALRDLERPAARWHRELVLGGAWYVHGLEAALERFPRAGDPTLAAARLYAALDDAPLLPFGDRVLEHVRELAGRRQTWRRVDLELDARREEGLELAVLERATATLAAYAKADVAEDVTDLELELHDILTKAA